MTSRGQTVGDLGEFPLIDRIGRILSGSHQALAGVEVGIGDDTAVLDQGGTDYLLATVDMLVEDIHFRGRDGLSEALGRRALTTGCSDIAAMGGVPRYALISLALRQDTPVSGIDCLYLGLGSAAQNYSVAIVGGNLSRTGGPAAIDVTVLGTVPKEQLVRRSGARPADLIAVTGPLGAAAALRAVEDAALGHQALRQALAREAEPVARIQAGRALAEAGLARAMTDVSDGLAGDLRHLCRASSVGAEVTASDLPISETTRRTADLLGTDPLQWAVTGGEDYELLLAVDPARRQEAATIVPSLRFVGRFVPDTRTLRLLQPDGRIVPLPARAWTHF